MVDYSNDMTDKEKMEFVFGVHEDDEVVENWDRQVATSLAQEEGIQLTDAHWEIVNYLHKLYEGAGARFRGGLVWMLLGLLIRPRGRVFLNRL